MSDIVTGCIKTWFEEKKWGFIRRDDAPTDIFFHVSALDDQFLPQEGQRVEFVIAPGRGGKPCANAIRLLP